MKKYNSIAGNEDGGEEEPDEDELVLQYQKACENLEKFKEINNTAVNGFKIAPEMTQKKSTFKKKQKLAPVAPSQLQISKNVSNEEESKSSQKILKKSAKPKTKKEDI